VDNNSHRQTDNNLGEIGGEDSSRGLPGCDAALCCGRMPTFQRKLLPPTSG